jgi:hypothetical protein
MHTMSETFSSPEPTNQYKFMAKDGLYYLTYSDYVAANVQHNHRILKEKGLDQASFRALSKNNTPSLRMRHRDHPSPNTVVRSEDASSIHRVTRSVALRRSTRQLGVSKTTTPHDPSVATISSDTPPRLTIADDFLDTSSLLPLAKKIRNIVKLDVNRESPLSDDDYHELRHASKEMWVEQMELYLNNVEKISHSNQVSVMRQIRKLVDGDGITYHNWPLGTCFYENQKLHLGVDCDKLYQEAVDYENNYGRDKGNGVFPILFSFGVYTKLARLFPMVI